MAYETAPLHLDLRWVDAGHRYALSAACGPGLTAVLGPGATSLLRILAGRARADDGFALLDGRPLRHGRAAARHGPETRPVAWVLYGDVLPAWRTALAIVTAAVRAHGVPRAEAGRRGAVALDWAGAAGIAGRMTRGLDAGSRERVLLARALAQVPGLLVLDRAFEALPLDDRSALWKTIERLAADWECVVLFACGDAPHAERSIQVPCLD